MWKIERLHLENFAHIYSGLGRKEVTLDFAGNDRVINIFIGKIGSGKSAILGHLQPFATYGTLDIRNQDDPIIPEENGLKEITYIHGNEIFEIKHVYQWNKHTLSHNTKSYIALNGTELNPNGNSGSFKELIKLHFGIEQNFLRVLRLGPNVANVIGMKSTERKSFVASLRSDTEIYLMLYKKLSEEFRTLTSTLGVLSKKLVSISSEDEDKLKDTLQELNEEYLRYKSSHESAQTEFFRQKGLLTAILQGASIEDLESEYTAKCVECDNLEYRRDELQQSLESVSKDQTPGELMKEIGMCELRISQIDSQATFLEEDIRRNDLELAKHMERKALLGEHDHFKVVQDTLASLEATYNRNASRLNGFQCKYSYRYLANFNDSLSLFRMQIDEIASYPRDTILKLYHADHSIITLANHKVQVLNNKIVSLRRQVNNLKFSATYKEPYPLFRPPMCPTESCPFMQTHPVVLIHGKKDSQVATAVRAFMADIEDLERAIAQYEEYPTLYQKIQSLKATWADIKPVLSALNALRHESIMNILITPSFRSSWCDTEKLLTAMELCRIREEQFNLDTQIASARQELAVLNSENGGNLDDAIQKCQETRSRQSAELQRLLEEQRREKAALCRLNAQYEAAEHADSNRAELETLRLTIGNMVHTLQSMKENIASVKELTSASNRFEQKIFEYASKLNTIGEKIEDLKAKLRDIKFTKKEFKDAAEARDELKLIVDAASTKEGIPLFLIKVFLDECREILNDLISDVFTDALEILEFNISESEFKIPYRINGMDIDDIGTASQGQQAIISIALSFALVRQSMFDYNIMLLDEVDGPLYKRDRDKFISILFKQLQAIGANQVFLITHNNTFDNVPANIIMTTEEMVDNSPNHSIFKLYEAA